MVVDYSLKNPVIIYTLEFITATLTGYLLYRLFPDYHMIWAMTSIALVLSPKSDKSRLLIYDRIKANLLGVLVGFLVLVIHRPNVLMFCLGAVVLILVSNYLRYLTSIRSSLVALVVVVIPEIDKTGHYYKVALDRIIAVIAGCIIALAVSIVFDLFFQLFGKKKTDTDSEPV